MWTAASGLLALMALALLLTGCAAPVVRAPELDAAAVTIERERQQDLALADHLEAVARLHRVGIPILVAGVPLCKERVSWQVNAWFRTLDELPEPFREAAARRLGVGDRPTAVFVAVGSPAERAGIQPGDVVTSLNGSAVRGERDAGAILADRLKKAAAQGTEVRLGLERDGASHEVEVAPVAQCDYPLVLIPSDEINAFADGERIGVFTGMMRFAADDDELALVIGHELAHNVMGHIDAKRLNAGVGLILDLLAAGFGVNTYGAFSEMGARAYSQGFESEADYVGLYLSALAGADIHVAADFWRRMGASKPGAIEERPYEGTHPSTPERSLHLEHTMAEIDRKRAQGLALTPEFPPGATRPAESGRSAIGFSPR
jgi:membrane-associated protease RseP (regulator of RpoE activity)